MEDLETLVRSMPKGMMLYRCFTDNEQWACSQFDGENEFQYPLVSSSIEAVLRDALKRYQIDQDRKDQDLGRYLRTTLKLTLENLKKIEERKNLPAT